MNITEKMNENKNETSNANKFSSDIINDIFANSSIDKSVLFTLLNSETDNPLRNSLNNKINNHLHQKFNDKSYVGNITIREKLTTDEQLHLQSTYDDLDLKFTNSLVHSHGYAAASRKCERKILFAKLNPSFQQNIITVKEIGGDIINSVLSGERGIHCCSPVLDNYDATRYTNRLHRAVQQLKSGKINDHYQLEVLTNYVKKNELFREHKTYCFNKSQDCRVKADSVIGLHSAYDISLESIGNIMDSSGALIGYFSVIFSPMILTDDSGIIDWINSEFQIIRDKNNIRKTIKFGFVGDNCFTYEHDYKTYIQLFCNSKFFSMNNSAFSLELLENRDGIQFFRVNRLLVDIGKPTSHRIYLTNLNNKYIIRFPYFSYNNINNAYNIYTTNSVYSLTANKFWQFLPSNTEWLTFKIDADIVDKTCAFVLASTEEKFKPEQIISYLRSITTREVMYNSISKKKNLPNIYHLSALAHAIYLTMYQSKYIFGKALQQGINNTNSLRKSNYWKDCLKEFDNYNNIGFFGKFVNWLMNRRLLSDFDPTKFIIKPSSYISITSIAGGKSNPIIELDNNYCPLINLNDIFVISDLSPLRQPKEDFQNVIKKKKRYNGEEVNVEIAIQAEEEFSVDFFMGVQQCSSKGYLDKLEIDDYEKKKSNILLEVKTNFEEELTSKNFFSKPYLFGNRIETGIPTSKLNHEIATELIEVTSPIKNFFLKSLTSTLNSLNSDISVRILPKNFSDLPVDLTSIYVASVNNNYCDSECYSTDYQSSLKFQSNINKENELNLKSGESFKTIESSDSGNEEKKKKKFFFFPKIDLKPFVSECNLLSLSINQLAEKPLKKKKNFLSLNDLNINLLDNSFDFGNNKKKNNLGFSYYDVDSMFDEEKQKFLVEQSVLYFDNTKKKKIFGEEENKKKKKKEKSFNKDFFYFDDSNKEVERKEEIEERFFSTNSLNEVKKKKENFEKEQEDIIEKKEKKQKKNQQDIADNILIKCTDYQKFLNTEFFFKNDPILTEQITDGREIDGKIFLNATDYIDDSHYTAVETEMPPPHVSDYIVIEPDYKYPRIGHYNPLTNLINVDGFRSECCFLAAAEDRNVEINFLRELVRQRAKPQPGDDLYTELLDGQAAGSCYLLNFANIYNVRIILNYRNQITKIECNNVSNAFRTITITLIDYHYYLNHTCKKKYDIVNRRDNMFFPFDLLKIVTNLKKKFDFVYLKNFSELISVDNSTTYLVNNLSHYCKLHDECRNNNLLQYLELVEKKKNSCFNLMLFIESNNFSSYWANNYLKNKHLNIIIHDYKIEGYFLITVHKTHDLFLGDTNIMYNAWLNHVCETGNNSRLTDENLLLTCSREKTCKVSTNKLVQNHNFLISILEASKNDFTSSGNNLIIYTIGEGTKLDDSEYAIKKLLNFFSLFKDFYLSIQVVSDFSNIEDIINIVKNKCSYLSVSCNENKNFLITKYNKTNKTFNYFPNITNINKKKNSMIEQYLIWENETKVLTSTLINGYEIMFNTVENGNKLATTIDNTLALFDLNSGKFVFGNSLNPPYQWGYNGDSLINTQGLFKDDGGVDPKVLNELRNNMLNTTKKKKHKIFKKNFSVKNGRNLYLAFSSKSKLAPSMNLLSDLSIEDVEQLTDFELTFVQGVPGGGKTEYILDNNEGKIKNLILSVTKEANTDMRRRAKNRGLFLSQNNIRTIDSLLLNGGSFCEVDEVWLDEALLVHAGIWCWIVFVTKCKKLIVVGDKAQIPFIDRNGNNICYQHCYDWEYKKKNLTINHRNPLDIVYWLDKNKKYDFNVTGTSLVRNSVNLLRINGISDVPNLKNTKYLTFTQSEKSELINYKFNVSTIHEYQGSQCDNVILVRLNNKNANPIYNSEPHILVALSRHRNSFKYYTILPSDCTSLIIEKIMDYSKQDLEKILVKHLGGQEEILTYNIKPDYAVVLYKEDKILRNKLMAGGETGYVSWLYQIDRNYGETPIIEHTPIESYNCINVLQDFNDRVFPGSSTEFRNHDHDLFEYHSHEPPPLGLSCGLTVPIFKKYDKLTSMLRTSIQYPLHASQKLSTKAFFERNGLVPQLQGYVDDYSNAELLLKNFLLLLSDKRPDFEKLEIRPNIKTMEIWLNGQLPTVKKILLSELPLYDQDFTVYNFMIKSIPKIDLELNAEFRYKSPQTIAYQTKTINSFFCPILKDVVDRVEFFLNKDVLLYNGMSPQEFARTMTKLFPFDKYNKLNNFFEVDFAKFDKSQGMVFLIFEALLMKKFGVPKEYIASWIIMHRFTKILDKLNRISAYVDYQRKSGDPGTWRFNTLVQIAVLNNTFKLYKRKSEFFSCFSGDDSLIFFNPDIKFNDLNDSLMKLQTVYNLEAKLMNYSVPYFCSKFLLLVDHEWIFVPDTLKLIVKLGRQDLVDENHVDCYRVSFLDNLYYYKNKNFWSYISYAINDRYKIMGEFDIVYETLLNLASKKENFLKLYYKGNNFVEGVFTDKPRIDIG